MQNLEHIDVHVQYMQYILIDIKFDMHQGLIFEDHWFAYLSYYLYQVTHESLIYLRKWYNCLIYIIS